MKLAVLYSGGKDSTYALDLANETDEVSVLLTLKSENTESYMFHTPNIDLTFLQAQALGIPQMVKETRGVKEEELTDLRNIIETARDEYMIEGVVTGAIESVYQASRVQRICDDLGMWCFNPLWKTDQALFMQDILDEGYEVIISGVFAYPFDESFLGRIIDYELLDELIRLRDEYGISVSGEGGEIETSVLDAPSYKKRIDVTDYERVYRLNSGRYVIKEARLSEK